MNSVIGTTIFGVITLAICAFIWIAGGKAQKEIEEKIYYLKVKNINIFLILLK